MNPKPPTNRNRRRSHSLIRWGDAQVALTFVVFAAASFVVGYGVTQLVLMFQTLPN
jgi:hypothetical protein